MGPSFGNRFEECSRISRGAERDPRLPLIAGTEALSTVAKRHFGDDFLPLAHDEVGHSSGAG
jgi:hypothetical protein